VAGQPQIIARSYMKKYESWLDSAVKPLNKTVFFAIVNNNLNSIIFCNTSPESYKPECFQKDFKYS
jgi:hypothetical protein